MSEPKPDTHETSEAPRESDTPGNFLDELVDEELRTGRVQHVVTRFPPEPNGYLHIGHAKAILLNFALAKKTPESRCHLRFDDTNPGAESVEFVESIETDVKWLGGDWGEHLHHAADYFEQLYQWAIQLIEQGKAYVDSQSLDEIRAGRGDFHRPGAESPHRSRSVAENLELFRAMRAGELPDGSHVLRAKIDMASKDLKLRDPLMYRIRKVPHHRTGSEWPIYPMYDWAHGQSDAIEGITHSICTLEFQNHRGLYEWFLDALGFDRATRPRQFEFARLNLSYTVLSKRKLQQLVAAGDVSGWDDPRMPTIAGMRRRGVPPEGIRKFCERIGVARRDGVVDVGLLEHALREELNTQSPRAMAVLRPLRVVIENYPEDQVDHFPVQNHPELPELGTREVPFCRELYIEREDFEEVPPKKWFRLAPGAEVRLRGACLVRCTEVIKDAHGEVVELRCTWDPDSRGGMPADGRKVKGTLHWVSARHAVDAEVRLYDRLFSVEAPDADENVDFRTHLNPESRVVLTGCKLEPALASAESAASYQFERVGYFCVDPDSAPGAPVWNRTIALKDSWANLTKRL
ncbi:MAG: glutamine--tRNA ligase/YqeY domain fusion protein [Myxococcota bacterium]|nr:glutamine--tRNA ligase/YqeY domain fusion protein [Myxococcota bacterium]